MGYEINSVDNKVTHIYSPGKADVSSRYNTRIS